MVLRAAHSLADSQLVSISSEVMRIALHLPCFGEISGVGGCRAYRRKPPPLYLSSGQCDVCDPQVERPPRERAFRLVGLIFTPCSAPGIKAAMPISVIVGTAHWAESVRLLRPVPRVQSHFVAEGITVGGFQQRRGLVPIHLVCLVYMKSEFRLQGQRRLPQVHSTSIPPSGACCSMFRVSQRSGIVYTSASHSDERYEQTPDPLSANISGRRSSGFIRTS